MMCKALELCSYVVFCTLCFNTCDFNWCIYWIFFTTMSNKKHVFWTDLNLSDGPKIDLTAEGGAVTNCCIFNQNKTIESPQYKSLHLLRLNRYIPQPNDIPQQITVYCCCWHVRVVTNPHTSTCNSPPRHSDHCHTMSVSFRHSVSSAQFYTQLGGAWDVAHSEWDACGAL